MRRSPGISKSRQASSQAYEPVTRGTTRHSREPLADPAEMNLLHMVTSDPLRTPTFTMFGNPNYYFYTGADNCNSGCVSGDTFAWNHGDFQQEIVTTWLGLVGPGVQHIGVESKVWSDHADIRPTMMLILRAKGRLPVRRTRASGISAAVRDSHVHPEQQPEPSSRYPMSTSKSTRRWEF